MIIIQSLKARIDIVFDVYIKTTQSKTEELESRGEATGTVHGITVGGQKIKQWRRPLRSSASKTALIKFLF